MDSNYGGRTQMLLDNFDALVQSYETNPREMAELIGMTFKVDSDVAVEMWEHLLKRFSSKSKRRISSGIFSGTEAYWLTDSILNEAEDAIGEEGIADTVLSNPFIRENVFELSGSASIWTAQIIRITIERNDIYLANELLEKIDNNNYKESSLYEVLEAAIPYNTKISNSATKMLQSWVDRIENRSERAKLNLKLMQIAEPDFSEDKQQHESSIRKVVVPVDSPDANVKELKELVDLIFSIGDTIDPLLRNINTRVSGRDIIKLDFVQYCLYLCASDGYVSEQEAQFMNYYFDYDLNASSLAAFIKESKVYSTTFETTVPLSFVLFSNLDKQTNGETKACEQLLGIYQIVGKALMSIDGVSDNEVRDYSIYTSMLQKYINS